MINTMQTLGEPEMAENDPKESNVVLFPGFSKNRPPQSIEEICRTVELAKTVRIEETTEVAILNLFEDLFNNGFDFTDREDANKNMAFLIETLKALLCKHDGIEHSFHMLAEQYFMEDPMGDLFFVDTVKVEPSDIDEGSGC